jgi:hypothetical protein
MPLAPAAAQRIPGRLRSFGPLGNPQALLDPMDPAELADWESSPLVGGAPQL